MGESKRKRARKIRQEPNCLSLSHLAGPRDARKPGVLEAAVVRHGRRRRGAVGDDDPVQRRRDDDARTVPYLRLACLLGIILLGAAATTAIQASAAAAPLRVRSHSIVSQIVPKEVTEDEYSLFDLAHRDMTSHFTRAALDLRPCVVVRFYDKQVNALPLLLFSLFASAHPHLKALVIDTGKEPYEKLPDLLRRVNQASGRKWVHAYDKKTEDVRAAFPDFHHEDYGYVLTDMALEDILRQTKARSGTFQCHTLAFTNADNVYSPHFIPAMLKAIVQGNDLVASHFVSHYPFPAERSTRSFDAIIASESGCGALRSGEGAEVVTSERFYPWCVELGSVMVTAKTIEAANIRFLIDRLRRDPTGDTLEGIVIPIADHKKFAILQMTIMTPSDFISNADGYFFYTLASSPKVSSKVLRRVLLLHL